MVEIYNIDIATHERFARDTQAIEAFRRQYHIPATGQRAISLQTTILDFIPKPPALTLLLQLYQKKNWALFAIPKNFHTQRFLTSYIAPSLGSSEKQDADVQKIRAFLKQKAPRAVKRREEKQEGGQKDKDKDEEDEILDEGETIVSLLEKGIKETNSMIDFVISRMHQFVQG